MRFENLYKLFTREDRFQLHKICGLFSLLHFFYRAYLLVSTGSMRFEDNFGLTVAAISIHFLLSTSSLIFKIPNARIKIAPMIYPEFRLHSIVFASRSMVLMVLQSFYGHYVNGVIPFYFRWSIIMVTMILADYITTKYGETCERGSGTTIRDMPFPDYISDSFKSKANIFYSQAQMLATAYLLLGVATPKITEYAFLILFPIQLAAFLMTLVKKGILPSIDWHIFYALSLLIPFLYLILNTEVSESIPALPAGVAFGVMRIHTRVSKYVLWNGLCALWLLYDASSQVQASLSMDRWGQLFESTFVQANLGANRLV
jgi:hypothetical protein